MRYPVVIAIVCLSLLAGGCGQSVEPFLGAWVTPCITGTSPDQETLVLRADGTGEHSIGSHLTNLDKAGRPLPAGHVLRWDNSYSDLFTWHKNGDKLVWTYKAKDGKQKTASLDSKAETYLCSMSTYARIADHNEPAVTVSSGNSLRIYTRIPLMAN